MFKRSITAELYAPKNIPERADSVSSESQNEWRDFILNIWQKHQFLILGGAFLSIFCIVFTLDYLRAITLEDLSVAVQRQQQQIQSIQLGLQATTKTPIELENGRSDSSRDDEQSIPDIKYWGMMRVGSSTKALIEINQLQKLLKVGEEIDAGWQVKSFDQELISVESKQGRLIKISMEIPS
jgi:hypothetical protein